MWGRSGAQRELGLTLRGVELPADVRGYLVSMGAGSDNGHVVTDRQPHPVSLSDDIVRQILGQADRHEPPRTFAGLPTSAVPDAAVVHRSRHDEY